MTVKVAVRPNNVPVILTTHNSKTCKNIEMFTSIASKDASCGC